MAPLRRTLPALALLAVVAHAAPLREDIVADWSRNFADVAAAGPHPLNRRDAFSSSSSSSSVDALLLQRPSSSTPPAARLDAPEAVVERKRQVGGVEALAEQEDASPAVATVVAPLAAAAVASPAVAAAAATSDAIATLAAAATSASPAVAATSNLVAAVTSSAPATTSDKPTSSSAATSSVSSNKASSSSPSSSSSSSSASATSSPSTGFTLSDTHNKLYPLWIGVTVCAIFVALFIILAGIRCCFFKPHAREDLDSALTSTAASSTLRKGAKSLRKALTRRKLAGSSFARRQQEGSVLLEVGDEVFAVPPQVAEEYNEAKRMFAPRGGAPNDPSKWNGKAYLAQCLVRHENQRRGGGSSAPSRLVGAQNNMASETTGWSRSSLSSTLVGLDDDDKEKSAYYDLYGNLERSESQKPRRGLSARIAESIRSLRTQGSGEEEIESDDRLGEPTRTTDLTTFLNAKAATPNVAAARAAPGGWSVQVRQDADESLISTPKPVAKDYYGSAAAAASRNIATAPRSNAGPTSSTPRAAAAAASSPSPRGGFALEDAPSAAARARVTENKRRPALPVIPGTPAASTSTPAPAVARKPVPAPQAVDLPTTTSQSSAQAQRSASRHQRAVSTPHVAFASKVNLHDAEEDDDEAVFLRRHPTAASSVGSWSSAASGSSNNNSLRRSMGTTKRPSRHASMASSTTTRHDGGAVQRAMTIQAPSSSAAPAAAPAGVGRDRLKEMRLAQAQQQGRPQQQQQQQYGRRHVSAAVVPSQQQQQQQEGGGSSLSRSSTMAAGMSRHRDQKKPRHSVAAAAAGREVDLERGV